MYLVWREGSCEYKIGMTSANEPKDRIRSLQTSHSRKLRLISYIQCEKPEELEKRMHEKWADRRLEGEWFEFGPMEIFELGIDFGFEPKRRLENGLSDYLDGIRRPKAEAMQHLLAQSLESQANEIQSLIEDCEAIVSDMAEAMSNRLTSVLNGEFLKDCLEKQFSQRVTKHGQQNIPDPWQETAMLANGEGNHASKTN